MVTTEIRLMHTKTCQKETVNIFDVYQQQILIYQYIMPAASCVCICSMYD